MGSMKKHWLGSEVYFSKENNILKKNNTDITYLLEIDCDFPQGSILGSLLSLIMKMTSTLHLNLKMSCLLMTAEICLSQMKYRQAISVNRQTISVLSSKQVTSPLILIQPHRLFFILLL